MAKPPIELNEPVINLSGFSDVSQDFKEKAEKEIEKSVGKISKLVNVDELDVHLKIHEKDGKERKFSFRSRLSTEKGFFVAASHGWNYFDSLKDMLNRLERETIESKHKKMDVIR